VSIAYTPSSRRTLEHEHEHEHAQQSKSLGVDSVNFAEGSLDRHGIDKQSRLELPQDKHGRSLQATRQSVVFDGCLFQDNKQGSSTFGGEQLGVITVSSSASDVVIKNSIFRENVFADTQRVRTMLYTTCVLCTGPPPSKTKHRLTRAVPTLFLNFSRTTDTLSQFSARGQH
jgi:hypothetical protein